MAEVAGGIKPRCKPGPSPGRSTGAGVTGVIWGHGRKSSKPLPDGGRSFEAPRTGPTGRLQLSKCPAQATHEIS